MGKVRDIRLLEDQRKILEIAAQFPFMTIMERKGNPSTEYLIDFRLKGYINQKGDISTRHLLRIIMPSTYPFSAPPKFTFLKGLFHPNVYESGDVCHGWYLNNWNPVIRIDDLLLDVIKMICFKPDSYNLSSPANYACNRDWIANHPIPIDFTNISLKSGQASAMSKQSRPTVRISTSSNRRGGLSRGLNRFKRSNTTSPSTSKQPIGPNKNKADGSPPLHARIRIKKEL